VPRRVTKLGNKFPCALLVSSYVSEQYCCLRRTPHFTPHPSTIKFQCKLTRLYEPVCVVGCSGIVSPSKLCTPIVQMDSTSIRFFELVFFVVFNVQRINYVASPPEMTALRPPSEGSPNPLASPYGPKRHWPSRREEVGILFEILCGTNIENKE